MPRNRAWRHLHHLSRGSRRLSLSLGRLEIILERLHLCFVLLEKSDKKMVQPRLSIKSVPGKKKTAAVTDRGQRTKRISKTGMMHVPKKVTKRQSVKAGRGSSSKDAGATSEIQGCRAEEKDCEEEHGSCRYDKKEPTASGPHVAEGARA